MSVFTKVSPEQLSVWLRNYAVGSLAELKGIAAGIENTNYFLTTTHGRFVLTLFEKLTERELPFYLNLMAHLARHGVPCASPIANRENEFLGHLNGKPAALVTCLPGDPVSAPNTRHCALIGAVLADMHLAGKSYPDTLENPRGLAWWLETAPKVLPFLDAPRRALLEAELDFQKQQRFEDLPRGPVHADLFRDNALWNGEPDAPRLGGVIDFYFAGVDTWLYDTAVVVNDWCVDAEGEIDPNRARAMLGAYRNTRAFSRAEQRAWPAMLRAGALRFWLSRLYDFYLPRVGELTHAHDPEHFRRILDRRRKACILLE